MWSNVAWKLGFSAITFFDVNFFENFFTKIIFWIFSTFWKKNFKKMSTQSRFREPVPVRKSSRRIRIPREK